MKNIEKCTQPVTIETEQKLFDLSMLEEMDDNDFLVEMINIFLLETPKLLKEINNGLKARKAGIVCQNAHRLKSSAGILQAGKLKVLLEEIETIANGGEINNNLISLVEDAVHQYSMIERNLKMHAK